MAAASRFLPRPVILSQGEESVSSFSLRMTKIKTLNIIEDNIDKAMVFSLSSFALWNIMDIFIDKIKPRKIYSNSFAIYAMHINISAIITKLVFLCFPKSEWMAIPNFIITTIFTLTIIYLICIFLQKFFPKVHAILLGNRTK